MSRRSVNLTRRLVDGGNTIFSGSAQSKTRSSPLLSVGLLVVGAVLLICYFYSGSAGGSSSYGEVVSNLEVVFLNTAVDITLGQAASVQGSGVSSCTLEMQKALPVLSKSYSDSMQEVLHVGPNTCSIVSQLLKEKGTEAWGLEPYDLDDTDTGCKSLVRKGIVRVADIKFPLPYRDNSFSLVMVSDAVDYLSPRYLNKTLPELIRVSSNGVVVFAGYPGQRRSKVEELSKFGRAAKLRSPSWWTRYFLQIKVEENVSATKKFKQAAKPYKPVCQVFHLKSSQ